MPTQMLLDLLKHKQADKKAALASKRPIMNGIQLPNSLFYLRHVDLDQKLVS